MFRILLLIMIVVPALEIVGLLTVGSWIGGWQTFALIILTGVVGAFLAKREGRRVWEAARYDMSVGRVPASSILDGICIFAGGLLLLTPGFLTDILGFTLVFPATRPFHRYWIGALISKRLLQGRFQFFQWRK
ncbi:FxsA family protein [Paenibacillus turpanensis]|uniref:FxsA family protein n=1 Tax=Paenibacillus turpanensis TaxID=2689078 RepID=UPI00140C95D8|nr:FxsA family protein [Paenibacillus turpanensis]